MEISMAIKIKKSYYNVNILQTFQMQSNGFPVPTAVTGNTSARMNLIIRAYLQALVNNNLLVSYHSYKLFYYYVRICEQKYLETFNVKKKLTPIAQWFRDALLLPRELGPCVRNFINWSQYLRYPYFCEKKKKTKQKPSTVK